MNDSGKTEIWSRSDTIIALASSIWVAHKILYSNKFLLATYFLSIYVIPNVNIILS